MLQHTLIREDFRSFVQKAFRYMHDGQTLRNSPYIDHLCNKLQEVTGGEAPRLIVNLPPRHLKTFLSAICLTAWTLGRRPATQVLITTHAEHLATAIAYDIRKLLQADWYQSAFKTRLAEDRTKVNDFATIQGGRVYAASIEGSITGRGADLLIVDDPLDIGDADNIEHIEKINTRFDTKIMSRLNNPKESRVVVIAHRLNEKDLSGHLKAQGGWKQISLPMIATRNKTYHLDYETWQRNKGELLRPDAFSKKDIKRLQNSLSPDFETLYQQNPGGAASLRFKLSHFQTFEHLPPDLPVVISVDPGQRGGANNSFSVIQAWCSRDANYYLIDQWRAQCVFTELKDAYWRFVRKHRPAVALIEATAAGPQLISEARRRPRPRVEEIVMDKRSKAERLVPHIPIIKRNHIYLPCDASWRNDFIAEFLAFPSGRFDDQVDAATQYFDFAAGNPILDLPEQRAIGVGTHSNMQNFFPKRLTSMIQTGGMVVTPGKRCG